MLSSGIWSTVIDDAAEHFYEAGISEPKVNAEYLALYILGVWNRTELQKFYDEPASEVQFRLYEQLVGRRLKREPLQHIVGETEFFGLRLFTSPAALIPRSETEILVEEGLKEAASLSKKNVRILDIGTGSGAIALALASRLPDASITGIDISHEAIMLAEQNKERVNSKNISFEEIDIFSNGIENAFPHSIDLLISNPPYISTEEFETLEPEVKLFDPRIALTDESDGLIFYKRIAELAPSILTEEGRIIVEIGYGAAQKVEQIFLDAGIAVLRIIKDLQGIERVVTAKVLNGQHY
jgi:release factor glutamine methyltransferase